jgi:hypothetical protein
MKDKYNLNDTYKYDSSNDIRNDLQSLLFAENLESAYKDNIKAKKINLQKDTTQKMDVNDIINVIFNQNTLNELSKKIINQQDIMIKQIINNRNDKMIQAEKDKQNSELNNANIAAKLILQKAGEVKTLTEVYSEKANKVKTLTEVYSKKEYPKSYNIIFISIIFCLFIISIIFLYKILKKN